VASISKFVIEHVEDSLRQMENSGEGDLWKEVGVEEVVKDRGASFNSKKYLLTWRIRVRFLCKPC